MIQDQPQQQLILEQAIAFAGKYARTFDPELLDHWYRMLVEQTLPPSASHVELAANNAVRSFVVGIIRQFQLATTGRPDTPWQHRTIIQAKETLAPAAKASRKKPRRRT